MLPKLNKDKFNAFMRWLEVASLYKNNENLLRQEFKQLDRDTQDFVYCVNQTLKQAVLETLK